MAATTWTPEQMKHIQAMLARDAEQRKGQAREMSIIRARRNERGLTLRDVRARTGIAISYLSSIEREPRAVSLNHARALARVLDSTVDELFPEQPPAPTAGATGEEQA